MVFVQIYFHLKLVEIICFPDKSSDIIYVSGFVLYTTYMLNCWKWHRFLLITDNYFPLVTYKTKCLEREKKKNHLTLVDRFAAIQFEVFFSTHFTTLFFVGILDSIELQMGAKKGQVINGIFVPI